MNNRIQEVTAAIELLQQERKDLLDQESERANADNLAADRKVRAEINDLVEMYNQQETEQGQRLARLFHLIKQRNGPRSVKFGNGNAWHNDWYGPDGSDGRHYGKQTIMITDVEPGV